MGRIFLKYFISSASLDSGNKDSKVSSNRKKSLYIDGFSKPGKNKRIASTTPSKFCTRRSIKYWLASGLRLERQRPLTAASLDTGPRARILILSFSSCETLGSSASVDPLPQFKVGRIVLPISPD